MAGENTRPESVSKKWRMLFAISLMVNMLVVGIMAGSYFKTGFIGISARKPPAAPENGLSPRDIHRLMPRSMREQAKDRMFARNETIERKMKELRKARMLVADAVENEPFSAMLLTEAFANLRNLSDDLRAYSHSDFVVLVEQMDTNERRKLASRLRDWRPRGKRKHPQKK